MPETRPVMMYHEAVARFKREYLCEVLKAHGGNRTRTAKTLGLERTYLLKLIRDFQLKEGADSKRTADVLSRSK